MSEVPLKPITKEDIRRLELALILGTLFRSDVWEQIKSAEDKVTWLDSLVIAAAALARERAGIPIPRIAEELGRSETTIRNHLGGKTEAGRIVRETYEMLVRSGGRLELRVPEFGVPREKELEARIKELEDRVRILTEKLEKVKSSLESILREIS